jgi:hypothetical protein
MSTATKLASVGARLASWGCTVRYSPGWATRGNAPLSPASTIVHHTASRTDVDGLLVAGRPGVPGPLCNIAGHADGKTVVFIAAEKANHAGVSTVSNRTAIGTEMTGPPLSANRTLAVWIQAAICLEYGWPVSRVMAHKEIARPKGRKLDPDWNAASNAQCAYSLADMPGFRADVAAVIRAGGPAGKPTSPPKPPEEEDPLAGLSKADITAAFFDAQKAFYAQGITKGQDTYADNARIYVDELREQSRHLAEVTKQQVKALETITAKWDQMLANQAELLKALNPPS